jgi:hypothetical protein
MHSLLGKIKASSGYYPGDSRSVAKGLDIPLIDKIKDEGMRRTESTLFQCRR